MTGRWDRRHLRRALVASRGTAGELSPAISKLADRGLVWPVLGAALAGRRSTRAAGAAGVAAVVVTSAVTGVIQQVVDRDRPSRLTALVSRGAARRPSSSSFPSTHAANAWAFAAATSVVRPGLAWLTLPGAVAIGGARVGMAHHYPSDVIAGAVIGACLGAGTGWYARRRHDVAPADDPVLSAQAATAPGTPPGSRRRCRTRQNGAPHADRQGPADRDAQVQG